MSDSRPLFSLFATLFPSPPARQPAAPSFAPEFLRQPGFTTRPGLCKTIYSRVLRRIDVVVSWPLSPRGSIPARLPRRHAKTNEHKAALELSDVIPLKSRIVPGDFMFTPRDFFSDVVAGRGDYLLTVKEGQPNLSAEIQAVFAEPPG